MATKKCMKCGGTTPKMAKGGATTNKLNKPKAPVKPQTGGSNTKMGIYGIPSAGPTGNNLSGTYSYKKGGTVTAVKTSCKNGMVRSATGGCVSERPKFAKGGFPDLNNDNRITKADILKGRGVIKKIGGTVRKRK